MGEFTIHLTEEGLVQYAEEILEKNQLLEEAAVEVAEQYTELLGDHRALEAKHERLDRAFGGLGKAYEELLVDRAEELFWRDRKAKNRRRQLRELQEKVEAMKTFKGILRTLGQRLHICK